MLYSAEESVEAGRTVAWWGFIATRGRERAERVPPCVIVTPVAVLAPEERVVELRAVVSWETVLGCSSGVSVRVDGCGRPVRAVQMSAIGGVASE
jgi:hypothetical protein